MNVFYNIHNLLQSLIHTLFKKLERTVSSPICYLHNNQQCRNSMGGKRQEKNIYIPVSTEKNAIFQYTHYKGLVVSLSQEETESTRVSEKFG